MHARAYACTHAALCGHPHTCLGVQAKPMWWMVAIRWIEWDRMGSNGIEWLLFDAGSNDFFSMRFGVRQWGRAIFWGCLEDPEVIGHLHTELRNPKKENNISKNTFSTHISYQSNYC